MSLGQKSNVFFAINSSLGKVVLILFPHVFVFILLLSTVSFMISYSHSVLIFCYVLVFVLMGISLVYYSRLYLNRSLKNSVYMVHKGSDGNWGISLSQSDSVKEVIISNSFESNFLLILNFIDSVGEVYSVLITADSVTVDEFRNIKVFLRTQKKNH